MTLPCVGAGITVVDPGSNDRVFERGRDGFMKAKKPKLTKHRDTRGRLLRAYVTAIDERWPGPAFHAATRAAPADGFRVAIYWACGKMANCVYMKDEGVTWVHGHGDQARAALLASRAMVSR